MLLRLLCRSYIENFKGKVEHQGNAIGAAFNKIDETSSKLNEAVSRIDNTTNRVDVLEAVVEDEKSKNVLALADNSERQDFQSNQSKSDCVLITGENQLYVITLNISFNVLNTALSGLKSAEFPTELASQNARAAEIIKELVQKVLGREEPFKVAVRRGANILRKARDSTLWLLPPMEVSLQR
jgi:hypothetical protein